MGFEVKNLILDVVIFLINNTHKMNKDSDKICEARIQKPRVSLEEGLTVINSGIDKWIKCVWYDGPMFDNKDFMTTFAMVYELSHTHTDPDVIIYAKEMYAHYNQTVIRVFIENSMSKITSASEDELYVVAKEQWSCFKRFTRVLSGLFSYVDRFYTKRQGLPRIKGGPTEERIFKEKVSSLLSEETINEIMNT